MTRRQRWLRHGSLAVAIALVFGMAGSSAGGQAPDERDELIALLRERIAELETQVAAQETQLNDYRCRFEVDTHLVSGGCTAPVTPTPTATATPQPTPTPTATPTPEEQPALPAGTIEAQWEQLRQCNANGNYQFSNPNGVNYGVYEFRQATWNRLARLHYPHLAGTRPSDAAPADQDRLAYRLYEELGWAPWPQCGASLPSLLPKDTTPTDPTALPPIPAGTTQAQWDHLIRCESHGNYKAYGSAGPYLGAFQFLQSTWDWVAGIHYSRLVGVDPRDAAPADQHRMAYALYGMQGWRPWPACSAAFRS